MNAVKMLVVSLATQDTAALARVLAADYRFRAPDRELGKRFPNGMDRLAQLDSVTHLPSIANHDPESGVVPNLSLFCEFPDSASAHAPAPAGERARVECIGFSMTLGADAETIVLTEFTPCIFTVSRGDAARLAPGQVRDRARWYVTEWRMDVAADRLGALADTAGSDGSPTPPPALGVRRLSPLGERPLSFALTLPFATPAHVQMFDLAGRRVLERRLAAGAPGNRQLGIEASDVAQGMYWLQVTQNGRDAVDRFVILR